MRPPTDPLQPARDIRTRAQLALSAVDGGARAAKANSPRRSGMDLILWNHAEPATAGSGSDRQLTARGRWQARQMGAWLERQLPGGARILASPAACAQETARALGRRYKTAEALGPGASVAGLLAVAGWPDARLAVLVVGHRTALGGVASFLLQGTEASWPMKTGSLWWLSNRVRGARTAVALRAMLDPDFV